MECIRSSIAYMSWNLFDIPVYDDIQVACISRCICFDFCFIVFRFVSFLKRNQFFFSNRYRIVFGHLLDMKSKIQESRFFVPKTYYVELVLYVPYSIFDVHQIDIKAAAHYF